jgi:hypothetical protein
VLVFYVVLAVVIVAGCIYLTANKYVPHMTVLAGAIALALLAPWGVYSATAAIAKNNDQTFYEFWNGSEVATSTNLVKCERDGNCKHDYDCDPYTVVTTETYTDEKGNTKSRPVTKTEYHSCPYSHEETDYIITTTLGDFIAGDSLMTGEQFRWNKEIPGGRQSAPVAWLEAKSRIDSGNPSGVTQLHKYKNFILAADTTLFKNYSDKIDSLLAENLLPTPVAGVHSLYQANKAYSVGDTKIDMTSMNSQLTQLNGFVGAELRGDMHIVFIEASKAGDPTDYTNALKAHWSSEAVGKNAIAKNTLTLVVGVKQKDDKPVVDWAKGYTGMPVGNEGLIQEFSNLKGVSIDGNFIGSPKFVPSTSQYVMTNGAVEKMVTGKFKFARVSMSASDANDTGSGFSYLSDSWEMKPATFALAILLCSIASAIILIIGALLSVNMGRSFNDPVRKFIKNTFSKN